MEKHESIYTGMAYETIGYSENPCLFLLHPLGGDRKSYEYQIDLLAKMFYLILPELPGHGKSKDYGGKRETTTLSNIAKHIVKLSDHLDIPEFHFLGVSIGGMIGQALGLEFPSRILSLALCNSSADMPKDYNPFWNEAIQTAKTKGVSALGESYMERFFTAEFRKANKKIIDQNLKVFSKISKTGFIQCVNAIKGLSFQDEIKRIKHPVLVTGAKKDQAIPVEAAQFMADTLPNATLTIFENSSHLSQIEEADLFNQTLKNFYQDKILF